jgi:Tfp pilus assembly protein PilE
MASPSTSRHDKGFTLIETLLVMGIFIVLMGVGGVIAFNSYKGYLFRSERSTAVSVLERARSRSIANFHEASYGVTYDTSTHSYILYKGAYVAGASENEIISGNPNSTISGLNLIKFNQLSGKPATLATTNDSDCNEIAKKITVTEQDKTSYICINNAGRINW